MSAETVQRWQGGHETSLHKRKGCITITSGECTWGEMTSLIKCYRIYGCRFYVDSRLRIVHRFSCRSRAAPVSRPERAASLLWLAAVSPHQPRAATVCFAVFSLLIILLDLVRRLVVHCTRLHPSHPAPTRAACRATSHVLWSFEPQ